MKKFLLLFFNTLLSVIRVVRLSFPYKGIKALTVVDQRILVLGNGPSLNDSIDEMDRTNSIFMVVNKFAFTEYFTELKPAYYVVIDPFFFTDNETFEKLFAKINQIVDWTLKLYLPHNYCRNVRAFITNVNIEVNGLILTQINGAKMFENFIYKLGLGIPRAQNVLVAAIFVSIQEGFKKVDIYGADHSWFKNIEVDYNNIVCLVDSHFYDASKRQNLVPWLGLNNENLTMKDLFDIFAKIMLSYEKLQSYAKYRGVAITNLSKVSYIDVFKRT